MAETTVNQSRKSADVKRLQGAIEDIDALAQHGFGQIVSIAKLALAALQTPEGHLDPENIVQALLAIRDKAVEVDNCINWAAEELGCNYIDQKLHSRQDAQRAARGREREIHERAIKPKEIPDAPCPDLGLLH